MEFVIECEVGYYRIPTAEKCEPCPSNLYGKKCASLCNCKENERCDSINGTCIPWTSTNGTFSEYSTVTQYQNQSTGENERRFGAIHTRSKGTESPNYGILVYMICAGLIIMMLCTVAAVYKYHHKNKNVPQGFPKHGVLDSTPPPIIARSMQPSVVIEVGGAYELIDDNNVLELEY
ncbi:MEGF10_11 [Mytilus edulis]|uniref:MEGF10_11 n=1 Tax=Mytilus edulis TaxID=6550 RepID=A0A8S3VBM7_MYTED|nr:MEGF10_11 [Mytilus edulis]